MVLVPQVMQRMEPSPFQDDAVPLGSMVSPGSWACPAQLGAELQWKHSSLNSNDSAACNFNLLEPRVR